MLQTNPSSVFRPIICLMLSIWVSSPGLALQQAVLDIADLDTDRQAFHRVSGSDGSGTFGLPVAGPGDVDGDGWQDYAVAYMTAGHLGRNSAGEVDLVFGNGVVGGALDTAIDQPRILRILGAATRENAGNEIWMDDVTGDGLADLLIGRQNFTINPERIGVGALSIIPGGAFLRDLADSLQPLDLAAPPQNVPVFTLVGRQALDRLGIWMRSGDVDGDGIADVAVGADQEDSAGNNSGAVYVVRGGPHLALGGQIDLGGVVPSGSPLTGKIARLAPPDGSARFHVGAVCFVADLDGNGRSEIITAAALNRAGATLSPEGAPGSGQGRGGAPGGRVYIAWDDNFPAAPAAWPDPFELDLTSLPGSGTVIRAGEINSILGEELVAGRDLDGDGSAELFVGDFGADATLEQNRNLSGVGYVFFNAELLKGRDFVVDEPPDGVSVSVILGPSAFAIGGDTVAIGDFNGDLLHDLAFGSPHHSPFGRGSAGSIHVIFGKPGGWPSLIDTAPGRLPPRQDVEITEIFGARGFEAGDRGDTLCYSASSGDVDGDGRDEIVTNEMVGNGVAPEAVDTGNLILLGGSLVSRGLELEPSAVFAARLVNRQFDSNPQFDVDTGFSVSNVLVVPAGVRFQGLDLSGTQSRGTIEFYLFDRDGGLSFFETAMNPSLGLGLDAQGRLGPGRTYTVGLGDILEFLTGSRSTPFDGYAWIVANFDGVAGSYSLNSSDPDVARNFELTPAVGQGNTPRAGLPLKR